jgi:hypothetical protein
MKKLLLLNEYNTTTEVFITASSKKPPSRYAHNDKLSVSKFGRTGEFTTCRLSCKLLVLSANELIFLLIVNNPAAETAGCNNNRDEIVRKIR